MADQAAARVAVYIDFDNIVISRYDQVWGRGKFNSERIRAIDPSADQAIQGRTSAATVDVAAVLDYASSYGGLVLSRAYADWSVPVNAGYQQQLLGRAVDLVQLFPSTRGMKNGADIRLAVDVVEDLFRLPDLTHVVIVAGDSDYIALAQRAKRLGKTVVGIGVAGATSKSLAAACDEFADYDTLPGVPPIERPVQESAEKAAVEEEAPTSRKSRKSRRQAAEEQGDEFSPSPAQVQAAATALLQRALQIVHQRDDEEWAHANVVKEQMRRMDPAFNEKSLGFRSFSDFVRSREDLVELTEDGQARLLRLKS